MGCRHRKIVGNTTKYFYCNVKEKAIDDCIDCKNCLLKLEDNSSQLGDLFGEIFGKGFKI